MADPETGQPIQLASATLTVTPPSGSPSSSSMALSSNSKTAVGSFDASMAGTYTVKVQMVSVAGESAAETDTVYVHA